MTRIMHDLSVMRVTIGQINTTNGDFESNTASVIRGIEQAKREDVGPRGVSGNVHPGIHVV